jgi:DNA-binding transcriptional LysR family regulator
LREDSCWVAGLGWIGTTGGSGTRRDPTIRRRGDEEDLPLLRDGPVDDVLSQAGLSRRVAVIVPKHAAAAFLILSARLTGIMAGFAAWGLASATSVRSYEIPADLPPLPISAGWHARYDADPEHRWPRSQIQDIASELAGTAASSARVQSR